ncbi:MAG TPA: Ldh family oxidoreductase [Anaerolineae bacterium]|nr:Ldh family oxidoreductase [Anaerolineae bacterium]HPL30300.1 Ldh family oxidoreductase [Anaerolineae bacterium]
MAEATDIQRIAPATLTAACEHLLQRVGVPADQAALTAGVCVQADLRGVESHGVLRLPAYVHKVKAGLMAADTQVEMVRDQGAMALLDGQGGFGQVAATEGMRLALRKARECGLAAVGVRNANHFGIAACYAMMALDEGMIGIVVSNAAPSMAPWGGVEAILGSNPLCVAIPTGTETPIVLDMATTLVARGKIRLAAEKGDSIPLTWALDALGQPTADPRAALAGTLLPIGGPKGYGLSLVHDVLAGVMTGSPFGSRIPSVHDLTRPSAVGFYLQAINIQAFQPLSDFYRQIQQLIGEVRGAKRAVGVGKIYLPGEPELERVKDRMANGIPVPPALLNGLRELAAELQVTLPF